MRQHTSDRPSRPVGGSLPWLHRLRRGSARNRPGRPRRRRTEAPVAGGGEGGEGGEGGGAQAGTGGAAGKGGTGGAGGSGMAGRGGTEAPRPMRLRPTSPPAAARPTGGAGGSAAPDAGTDCRQVNTAAPACGMAGRPAARGTCAAAAPCR